MKSIWSIISAVVAVIALLTTIYIFSQQRADSKMRLRVELLARSALVDTSVSRSGKGIQILYNGRNIENFAIYQFRISNPGGRPIRSSDYEEAVTLTFKGVDEIVSTQQTAGEPASLKVQPKVEGMRITLPAVLLNPTDSCSVEVAVIPTPGANSEADVSGRIAGVRAIEFVTPNTRRADSPGISELLWAQLAAVAAMALATAWRAWRR